MAGLVDYQALVVDLRGRLLERPSWGAGQLQVLISELELEHRIDESADASVLRRFSGHLTDTFLGILPPATPDPLPSDDRMTESSRQQTSLAMDDGAVIRSPYQEDECPPPTHPSSRAPALT